MKTQGQDMALESSVRCQEGVKKTPLWQDTGITSTMLRELRLGLSESLAEFGLTLKRAMDPRAEKGFTRQYVSRLEHGQDAITAEIAAAFWNIAAAMDDVPVCDVHAVQAERLGYDIVYEKRAK